MRQASEALLRAAESELALFGPARDPELPGAGQVAIRALTVNGHLVVTTSEDDFRHGRHPTSPVFHAAHEVITEVRLAPPRYGITSWWSLRTRMRIEPSPSAENN